MVIRLIIVLVVFIWLNLKLVKHTKLVLEFGISPFKYFLMWFSFWVYLVPVLSSNVFNIPFYYQETPIPILFVLFIPGILLSKGISDALDTSGYDVHDEAAKDIDIIKWVGYLGGVAYILVWLIDLLQLNLFES